MFYYLTEYSFDSDRPIQGPFSSYEVRLGQPASSTKQNPTVFPPWEYVKSV